MATNASEARVLIDDALLVLATAHGASVEASLSSDKGSDSADGDDSDYDPMAAVEDVELQRARWAAVASNAKALLESYVTSRKSEDAIHAARGAPATLTAEVLALQRAPELNSPDACQERARYVVWKTRRESADRGVAATRARRGKHTSDFNVAAGDSIAQRIAAIVADATKALPSIADVDDNSSDDGDGAVAVYQPPRGSAMLSEEELEAQAAANQAEEDLMQRIQHLQQEHYRKHRKWVDIQHVGGAASAAAAAAEKAKAKSSPDRASSEASAARSAKPGKRLVDFGVEDVARLLSDLGLADHGEAFRRTNGRVLATMSRSDIRLRFRNDAEASDILWYALESRRSAPASAAASTTDSPSKGAGAQVVRHAYDALRQPKRDAMAVLSHAPRAEEADPNDPVAQLKRAMNPNRPTRPSRATYEDMERAAADAGDNDEDLARFEAAYVARVGAAAAPASPDAKAAAAPAGAARHADPVPSSASTKKAAAAPATQPPQRGGRWSIVEYDDDDEEDN